ncbi:MAG: hypothetical protein OEZ22_09695 [Spirochaetia bacterium]|nr:hypothetical protein [Spirochaetia bacterium]
MISKKLEKGDKVNFTRHISRQNILDFAQISEDHGDHHVTGEKLLAHGLLVATLPTKLGGDLNFIASNMYFEFVKGVYENETVTCVGHIDKIIEQSRRYKVWFSFNCYNEKKETVLKGTSSGMIWKI